MVAEVIRLVGDEVYGQWITVVAALGWLSWGQAGLAPGLVNEVAAADAVGDKDALKRLVTTSTLLATVIALAILMAIILSLFLITNGRLGDSQSGLLSTIITEQHRLLCIGAATIACAGIPLGLVESTYVGLQALHRLRAVQIVGYTLAVLVVVVSTREGWNSTVVLILAGAAQPIALSAAALYLFAIFRRDLWPRLESFNLRGSRSLFSLSSGFLIVEVAGYAVGSGGILILSASQGAASATAYGLPWQLYAMAATLWSTPLVAMWGGLGEARARQDWRWIRRAVILGLAGTVFIAGTFALVLAVYGPAIVAAWSGQDIGSDPGFYPVMALNCFLLAWSVSCAQLLAALNLVWSQLPATVAKGILAIAFALVLVPRLSTTGLALALLLSTALTTAWYYPRLLLTAIREGCSEPNV